MRRFDFAGAALAAALLAASGAAPARPGAEPRPSADRPAQTMKCPIGGATFSYKPALPPAAIGYRPDGRPYADGVVPPPLPECPDNALVLYKDYSDDEIAKLTPLVESADYQALRKEGQYYRAFWLMKQMGVDSNLYLLALLEAAWQADDRPELRARYLAEFADESAKVEPRPDDINWVGMEGRAVNALRELGRFDEAEARLAKVPLDALKVPDLAGATGADARRAQLRRTWLTYFEQEKAAIARRDSAIEPYEMIPKELALRYCLERATALDTHQQAFCTREKAAVDAMRSALDNSKVDLKALERPRSESGR
jgi:hypothetical protein